jgi:hypothetical protein
MMSEGFDHVVAAYALGLSRRAARAPIEARRDFPAPALQAKVKLWQENFAAVDLAAGRQVPSAGLFDTILDILDAGEKELPGTLTRRAGTGVWTEMSPGVTYTSTIRPPSAVRCSCVPCRVQPMSRISTTRAMRNVSSSKAIL